MPLFRKGAQEEDPKQAQKALKVLMGRLEKDQGNPDLWLQAAKAYLTLGNLDEAKTCAENALGLDSTRGDAKLLLDDIEVEIDAQKGPAPESEGTPTAGAQKADVKEILPEDQASSEDDEPEAEPEPEEPVMKTEQAIPWVPEEERSRFNDPEEALVAFRTELTPGSTITCPHCNTLLEVDAEWCYGCGRPVAEETETLEKRVDLARSLLKKNPQDKDALFTMAAFHAVNEELDEAMEVLDTLTAQDEHYPGLWWLRARVFELLGNRPEARAAIQKAMDAQLPVPETS